MAINSIFAIVALIVQLQSDKPIGTATGFFYEKNNITYFVTNRHVVLDEDKERREARSANERVGQENIDCCSEAPR